MSLRVHARLVDGCPCVELRDEHTGQARYRWHRCVPAAYIDGHAVQDPIRMLLLASAQPDTPQTRAASPPANR